MSKKGIVMEINGKRAVIMTEQCEFKEIKINGWQKLGDQVTFSPADVIVARPRHLKVMGLVASFLIVFFTAFTVFQSAFTDNAYAYIGIDVNPSMEIGIDKDLRVTSITSYDDKDGSNQQYRYLLNRNVEQVLKTIVTQYQYDNILSPSQRNYIAITVYQNNENKDDKTLESIKNILGKELKQRGLLATVYYYKIDKETRQAAIKNKISPTKYLLREECKRKGIQCELEELSLKNAEINKVAGKLKQLTSQEVIDLSQPKNQSYNKQNQYRNNNGGQQNPPMVNQQNVNPQNRNQQNSKQPKVTNSNANNNYSNQNTSNTNKVEKTNQGNDIAADNKGAGNNNKDSNVDKKRPDIIEPGPKQGAGNGHGGKGGR